MASAPKFRGDHTQKIDAKGRVSVPAPFRRIIETCDPAFVEPDRTNGIKGNPARVICVFGGPNQTFLEFYTPLAMEAIDAMIDALPYGSKARNDVALLYYSQSCDAEIDGDGRIIVPQNLREKLDIGENLRFLGNSDTFRVWKPETYDAFLVASAAQDQEIYGADYDPRVHLQGARRA